MKHLLFLVFCVFLISVAFGAKFPSELQKCYFGDGECIKDQINAAIKEFPNGNAALNLAMLNPVSIDTMQIAQGGSSPVNLVIDFKKAKLIGVTTMEFYKVTGFPEDIDNAENSFRLRSPRLSLVGPFKVNGKVLILPITGNGNANITLDGMDMDYKFTTKAVIKNGKVYMNIADYTLDFESTRFWLYFDSLFNGDKALTDNMNEFLNANWEELLKELKPKIADAFGNVATQLINSVFARRPYKDHFQQVAVKT